MKILLASTGSDISSGAVRCLIELAENLSIRGIEVLVIIPKPGNIEPALMARNIRYKYVHEYHSWYTSEKHKKNHFLLKRILNVKTFFQIRKLIKSEHIDIVHENALTAYVAAKAAQSSGIPVVWHIREFMEEDLGISFYNKKYSEQIINKSDILIAISQSVADRWKSSFSVPIEVVYDGVPVENYFVERNGFENNREIKIIIYGRIVEPKGQLFFFHGMQRVLESIHDPVKIYWAGFIEDEDYYHQICDFIKSSGMKERVEYLSQVSDMKEVLKDMDIVAVCSHQEGFGRVTVESMLAGCIVVGADTGATKEIISNGHNGYLYREADLSNFVDTMTKTIRNIDEARKMIPYAQETARDRFSIETNINSIIRVYNRVLGDDSI